MRSPALRESGVLPVIVQWVIIAALYSGPVVANSKIFMLDADEYKTEADCEKLRADLIKEAESGGLTVRAKCVNLDFHPPDPKKPDDKKSEVTS